MIKTRGDGYSDSYYDEGTVYQIMEEAEEARRKLKKRNDKKNKTPDEQA